MYVLMHTHAHGLNQQTFASMKFMHKRHCYSSLMLDCSIDSNKSHSYYSEASIPIRLFCSIVQHEGVTDEESALKLPASTTLNTKSPFLLLMLPFIHLNAAPSEQTKYWKGSRKHCCITVQRVPSLILSLAPETALFSPLYLVKLQPVY